MGYVIETKAYDYFVGAAYRLGKLPHIHTHLELIYMRKGKSVAILDGQRHEMETGDLFLAFPNQVHYYEDQEPIQIFISIFSPSLHRQLDKMLAGKIPLSPVLKKEVLPPNTEEILQEILTKSRFGDGYDKLSATGQLLSFLGKILPLFEYQDVLGDQDSVKRILAYCSEHYTEPLTLDVLSEELYLSKFYISRVFRERMHYSFTEFIGNLRVSYACDLLQSDQSITQAALSSGFSTIRTFNRVFLKVMGMTPREYIKQNQISLSGKKE